MNETFQQPARWHDGEWSLEKKFEKANKKFSLPPHPRPRLLTLFPLFSFPLVILTPPTRPAVEPLTHAMSFTLRGLQSGSVYEAIVQAKNRYGWNEVSGRGEDSGANLYLGHVEDDAEIELKVRQSISVRFLEVT